MDELRIYYSHNPITYTLNKLIAQQNPSAPSQQITARGIETEGAIGVIDDGVWNIDRTLNFLEQILSVHPSLQQPLHLFLPHTGYLLGKLVKIASKITSYSYVEEGEYSITKTFGYQSQQPIDCKALLEALKVHDLLNRLGLKEQDVWDLNEVNNFFYDCEHFKYKGAYAFSDDAFKGFPNVKRFKIDLPLERTIHFNNTTLVVLPPLFQLLNSHPEQWGEILANLVHLVQVSKCAQTSQKIVLKLHPQDHYWLQSHERFGAFVQSLKTLGPLFGDIQFPDEIDPNIELGFLGFEKYLVMGQSSASMYLKQCVSPQDYEVIDITGQS